MAHEYTAEVNSLGDGDYQVLIDETGASASSEAVVNDDQLPRRFRIVRQVSVLSSGTGTTVDPVVGRTTNPSGRAVLVENADPAATVDNVPLAPVPCYNPDSQKRLFHRSRPNAGSDNVIQTEYLLREGWHG